MLDHHLQRRLDPALVAVFHRRVPGRSARYEAGLAAAAVVTDPAPQCPHPDLELRGLRRIPLSQRHRRVVLGARFSARRQLRSARPVPGQHLAHVRGPFEYLGTFGLGQHRCHDGRQLAGIVGARPALIGDHPHILRGQQLSDGNATDLTVRLGSEHDLITRRSCHHLDHLDDLTVVDEPSPDTDPRRCATHDAVRNTLAVVNLWVMSTLNSCRHSR